MDPSTSWLIIIPVHYPPGLFYDQNPRAVVALETRLCFLSPATGNLHFHRVATARFKPPPPPAPPVLCGAHLHRIHSYYPQETLITLLSAQLNILWTS